MHRLATWSRFRWRPITTKRWLRGARRRRNICWTRTTLRTPSMTNYEFAEVVLVRFPQSGSNSWKQRPGIVMLDIGDADIVIAPVTSKTRSQAGDIALASLHGS